MEAIRVENVWKTYRRGSTRRGDLRQSVAFWWHQLWKGTEEFNALEAIDITIAQGDVIGLLGPNGAGKSTLLKLLSRITHPTRGRITIHGTLSSLLEIGIGFHPELTGRDNIYLNGVIHGMNRKEIDARFDEIVDFSGLESYLETPVKHYSSGMFIRLAFSIAAHLQSDILLLDEVLGVGDLEFKKKSLQKLQETVAGGRTIIMVSHQLELLRSLCTKGIYLNQGKIREAGPIDEVIDFYIADFDAYAVQNLATRKDRQGSGVAMIQFIRWVDTHRQSLPEIQSGQSVIVQVGLSSNLSSLRNVEIRLDVLDAMGQPWFVLSNNVSDGMIESCPGQTVLECVIPRFPLAEGHYIINASLNVDRQKSDIIQQANEFKVVPGEFYKTGRTAGASKGVLIDYHWKQMA